MLGDVGEVIEDQQVVLLSSLATAASRVSSRRALQPLSEVGGAGEQHREAVLDER